MVKRIIAKVREALASQEEQPPKKAESKLLLIIQFQPSVRNPGGTVVLEKDGFQHESGHHYDTEAVQLFTASFGWRSPMAPMKQGPLNQFTHQGAHWHVVVLPMKDIGVTLIEEVERTVEKNGAKLVPIKTHPLFEEHLTPFV